MSPVTCERCGVCCGPYLSLYVEDDDLERWQKEGRLDIIQRVEWERNNTIWLGMKVYSLETYRELSQCYYLRYLPHGLTECAIHQTKPRICREFQPGSGPICRLYPGEDW